MKYVKYFIQFIFIIFLFIIYKLIGLRFSSFISGKLFQVIGPLFKFRPKKIIYTNIKRAFPDIKKSEIETITTNMWNNYGRVFAEYMFIKKLRNEYFRTNITVKGLEILKEIKKNNKPVIFISGHFSNFELMAMTIEKFGLRLAAIYRPLNNRFLNVLMEKIRKNHICKFQIKKGVAGLRKLIKLNKEGFSTALMIDQRVTEGIKSKFFNENAFTTTIPAQLIKKYGYNLVPVFVERLEGVKFEITFYHPIKFSKDTSEKDITQRLNNIIEKMIIAKPEHWIWSHNRWK